MCGNKRKTENYSNEKTISLYKIKRCDKRNQVGRVPDILYN